MQTNNFHHSEEENENKSFEERFEAFKNKFTVILDTFGVNTVADEKIRATAPENNEKKQLKDTLNNQKNIREALDKLEQTTQKTEGTEKKEAEKRNIELFRSPVENIRLAAQNLLTEIGLADFLNQRQKETNARLGQSCIYSFNGMEDFA